MKQGEALQFLKAGFGMPVAGTVHEEGAISSLASASAADFTIGSARDGLPTGRLFGMPGCGITARRLQPVWRWGDGTGSW